MSARRWSPPPRRWPSATPRLTLLRGSNMTQSMAAADLILHNGRVTTLDPDRPEAGEVAVKDGYIVGVGNAGAFPRSPDTPVIDLHGRRVIPGLYDSHLHLIRGGLNYNMELRWDGVPSLADALRMLREQSRRTPPPQWVRVVGGWTEFQFAERRMPTIEEINAAAPDTPVFVLHLYDRALLNRAALQACGYTKDTPDPPGGEIQRDKQGNPTGLLIARPNAMILYATLAKGPKLSREDQTNSTRQFMRELNRFGITSVIDAGGGFQNYPDDYEIINELHGRGELTVRFAYNLFTQKPKQELADFQRWTKMTRHGAGDDFYRMNGAGEMLVFSAADFEDFLEPRPDMPPVMEEELKAVIRHLVENRWPFRLHATYDETISHALEVYEEVNREVPFDGLHWFFDHCETISDRNIGRIKALGGGMRYRTGWRSRANILLIDTVKNGRSVPLPSGECWNLASLSEGAQMQRESQATTRSWHSTGWLRARASGAPRSTRRVTGSTARRHYGFTPSGAVGSLPRRARKAQLRRGNWPILVCSRPITSLSQKSRLNT